MSRGRRLREQEAENAPAGGRRRVGEVRPSSPGRRALFADLDRPGRGTGWPDRGDGAEPGPGARPDRGRRTGRRRPTGVGWRELRLERLGNPLLRSSRGTGATCSRARGGPESPKHGRRPPRTKRRHCGKEAADLRAPTPRKRSSALGRRRERRADLPRRSLPVGLAVELELEAGIEAEVRTDGQADAVRIGEGRHVDIEARRELAGRLPGRRPSARTRRAAGNLPWPPRLPRGNSMRSGGRS